MEVSFLGRLVAGNRLTVLVEIRWRFKLEPGEICLVRLEFEGWGFAEFYAWLQRGGQVSTSPTLLLVYPVPRVPIEFVCGGNI